MTTPNGPAGDPLPEAMTLVGGAAEAGYRLKILGGMGVRVLCPDFPPRQRAGQGSRSGQASAQAIGVRMSGGPSCASVEPSSYSTRLCTTDWGCTMTSMRSSGAPNR